MIEKITYLLFIKRLDDLHTLEENKSQTLGIPMDRRIFPLGKDDKGCVYEDMRWSRFKHVEPRRMMDVVADHVFPFLRNLGEEGSSYGRHMRDARLGFGNPALLAKAVEMVEMVEPTPDDVMCDPAAGTFGFPVAVGESVNSRSWCCPRISQSAPVSGHGASTNTSSMSPSRSAMSTGRVSMPACDQGVPQPRVRRADDRFETQTGQRLHRTAVSASVILDSP